MLLLLCLLLLLVRVVKGKRVGEEWLRETTAEAELAEQWRVGVPALRTRHTRQRERARLVREECKEYNTKRTRSLEKRGRR